MQWLFTIDMYMDVCILNCLHVSIISYRALSLHQVSLLYTYQVSVKWLHVNVLPECVYCCFTRTTLFTTMNMFVGKAHV